MRATMLVKEEVNFQGRGHISLSAAGPKAGDAPVGQRRGE
jgi:hypothetical protein